MGEITIKLKGFKEKYVIVCNCMRGKGDYKNGKIYKIWSLETDKIYIGSTYGSLTNRICRHIANYKRFKAGNGVLVTSAVLFDLVGVENCKIELIHNYPCESKSELEEEEGRVMRENKEIIINRKLQGRGIKEHYQDNKVIILKKCKEYRDSHKEQMNEYRDSHKEQIKIKNKEYQQQHKEEISIKRSKKMTCECGVIHTLRNKSAHLKTKKHQDFIKPQ